MGLHKWKCISPGMYDDLLKCEHCGEEFMEQADNFPHGQAPKDGCEKAPPTDAERIAALEADRTELDYLLEALKITDTNRIEWIKEAAMARGGVKGSRRQHVLRVLDEAFSMLLQEGGER